MADDVDEEDRRFAEVELMLDVLDRLDTIIDRDLPCDSTDAAKELEERLVRKLAGQFAIKLS